MLDYSPGVPSDAISRIPFVGASLSDRLTPHSRRAGRYIGVSLFNNVTHQSLLFLANSVWGWPGGVANLFAGIVGSIPAYILSRWWVWEVRQRRHDMRREVLPFLAIALLGLLVSTIFAEIADRWFGAGLFVNAATLFGYFLVWLLKYFLLDRLFAARLVGVDESIPPGEERRRDA